MVDELLEAQRLASRLRRVRLERGLSLRGAAVQVGVTKETLSDLERARRHPHPPTLAKIAKGYGVEISDLLGPMVDSAEGHLAYHDPWEDLVENLSEEQVREVLANILSGRASVQEVRQKVGPAGAL
jgi:transcriptional regulator with XRE-family HTH domain